MCVELARSHLVLLALLVGSDYTVGLTGVGPVTALEILSTFPLSRPDSRDAHELLVSLTRFREWCCTRPDTHSALAKKLRNVDVHEGKHGPQVTVLSCCMLLALLYLTRITGVQAEPASVATLSVIRYSMRLS